MGKVFLKWSAPATDSGSPITDYVIEVSTDGSSWKLVNDGVSATTSATVTSSPFARRWFRVSAKNAIGTGTVAVVTGVARF